MLSVVIVFSHDAQELRSSAAAVCSMVQLMLMTQICVSVLLLQTDAVAAFPSLQTLLSLLSLPRDMSSLQTWAVSKGVLFHDRVHLVNNDNGDAACWGLQLLTTTAAAAEAVAEATTTRRGSIAVERGSIVLQVPTSIVWNAGNVYDELLVEIGHPLERVVTQLQTDAFSRDFIAEFVLFIKLLKETGDTPTSCASEPISSQWTLWIDSLPRTFSTGVTFTVSEKACLPMHSRALAEYEGVKFQTFCSALQQLAVAAVAAADSSPFAACLWLRRRPHDVETLKWAYNVVFTRCWKQTSMPAAGSITDNDDWRCTDIVPIGDMFNHREPANVIVVRNDKTDMIEFIYTGDNNNNNNNGDSDDSGLYLSYGMSSNAHRFLSIFGFVDQGMSQVWSQLVFFEPDERMRALGCDDRSQSVVRAADGAVASAVWDSILYALLATRPAQQTAFYNSCMIAAIGSVDGDEQQAAAAATQQQQFHDRYAPQTSAVLRNHVVGILQELDSLQSEQIIQRMAHNDNDNDIGGGDRADQKHPNLELIRRHNAFLTAVFSRVLARLA